MPKANDARPIQFHGARGGRQKAQPVERLEAAPSRQRRQWSSKLIPVSELVPLMRAHRGIRNATPARRLGLVSGVTEQDIGRVVRESVVEANRQGHPIAAVPSGAAGEMGGGGYFWIDDESDLTRCALNLVARIAGTWDRLALLGFAYFVGTQQVNLYGDEPASRLEPAAATAQFNAWLKVMRERVLAEIGHRCPAIQVQQPAERLTP